MKQSLRTILISGGASLCLLSNAFADYYKLKQLSTNDAAQIGAVSQNATVVFDGSSSSYASLGSATIDPQQSGDHFFTPQAVNNSGDVVGIAYDTDSEGKIDYAFYTPKGGSSQLILSAEDIVSGGINNTKQAVIARTGSANFFNAGSSAGTVTLGVNQEFAGRGLMLASGDYLTTLKDEGTARWARVSRTGGVTVFSESVLPNAATLIRESSSGRVLIFNAGVLQESDLVHSPVSVSRSKYLINADSRGHQLFSEYAPGVNSLGFPNTYYPLISKSDRKHAIKLQCAIPKKHRLTSIEVQSATQDGSLVASLLGKTRGLYLLTPTGGALTNYCPTLKAEIVGACAKGFKKGSLSGKVKNGSTCKLQVSLTANGKPLAGRLIATNSYPNPIFRGRTDKNGRLTFSFKVKSYSSQTILAPYGDKTFQSQEAYLGVDTF